MTDKMADQILKELEQSNRLVAELVKAVERQNEILDEKLDDIATAAISKLIFNEIVDSENGH